MSITLLTRYGAQEVVEDPRKFKPEIRRLIDEHGATPLHWAALAGQYEACLLLLAEGADPSETDQNGETAIEYGALSDEYIRREGAEKIVRALRKGRKEK